jgi:hypothetical protein
MNLVNSINVNTPLRLPSNGGSGVITSQPASNQNQDANFVMPSNDQDEQKQEEKEVTHAVKKHSFLQTLKNWVEGTISFLDAGVKLVSKWGKQAWGAVGDKLPYLLAIVPEFLVALFLGKGAIDNSERFDKSKPNLQKDKTIPATA